MQVGVLESAGLTRVRELLVRIEADALAARFSRGAAYALVGAVVSQGLALAASVALGRILGASTFGKLGMIQSTVGMFGVFAGMGLGMTAAKYVSELRKSDPERAALVLTLTLRAAVVSSTFAAVLLLALARPLASGFLNAPELGQELRISSGLLFLNGVTATQAAALAGFEAFDRIAKINVTRALAYFPLSILGAMLWGMRGAVVASMASAAVAWQAGRLALGVERRRNGMTGKVCGVWAERRVLWDFSTPAFFSGAVVTPVTWVGNALLVNQPDGYREMGIFNAANQWRIAVTFLPSILTQPTLPILSNLLGQGDLGSFKRFLWTAALSVSAITTLAAGFVVVCGRWILATYGPDFQSGVTALRLLAGTGVLSCPTVVIGNSIASMGKMWALFGLNLLWAIGFVLLALWLVPQNGATGLGVAMLASYAIHALTIGAYARSILA